MDDNILPLISICIPVYNEEQNINYLYERLDSVSKKLVNKYNLEFIFTDNNSTDSTWVILSNLAKKDSRVKAIKFAKNIGFQRSIYVNYLHAKGDAVLQLDADLQDPPEMLEEFLEYWKQGYSVVYGIRNKRKEGFFYKFFIRVGYWIINKISDSSIPRDVGDFRLVDRKVIDYLKKYRLAKPYLRGIISSMGFKQIGIKYDRDARIRGESKFNLRQLISLGLSGVVNHSLLPLRIASYSGLFILILCFFGAIYYLLLKLIDPNLPVGYTSMHILIIFGIGVQSLFLGIIGEYLLRIYMLMRNEPIAIIDDSLNFHEQELVL